MLQHLLLKYLLLVVPIDCSHASPARPFAAVLKTVGELRVVLYAVHSPLSSSVLLFGCFFSSLCCLKCLVSLHGSAIQSSHLFSELLHVTVIGPAFSLLFYFFIIVSVCEYRSLHVSVFQYGK